MHKIELICYAGSLACLKAALNSGADSVYVGGESFGRDTLSQEFSREDLIEGIKFAHENNKKVYVTINLLPHNKDFDKFKEFLNDLNEMKVDAVIVSEPGTLITVKQLLPEMKIHLGMTLLDVVQHPGLKVSVRFPGAALHTVGAVPLKVAAIAA